MNRIHGYLLLALAALLVSPLGRSQTPDSETRTIDSLKAIVNSDVHDTLKVEAYKLWDNLIYTYDPDLDLSLNLKIEQLCSENLRKELNPKEKLVFLSQLARAYHMLGHIQRDKGETTLALAYYRKGLDLSQENDLKSTTYSVLVSIATAHRKKGDFVEAIAHFNQAQELAKSLDPEPEMSTLYNNLGNLHLECGNFGLALNYYKKGIEFARRAGDSAQVAKAFMNIGLTLADAGSPEEEIEYSELAISIARKSNALVTQVQLQPHLASLYAQQGDFKMADELLRECYDLSIQTSYEVGTVETLITMGRLARQRGETGAAHTYFRRADSLSNRIAYPMGFIDCSTYLGDIALDEERYDDALLYGQKGLEAAQRLGLLQYTRDAAEIVYKTYLALEKDEEAYQAFQVYIAARDSFLSWKNKEEFGILEFEHFYGEKSAADSVRLAQEAKVKNLEIAKQDAILAEGRAERYSLYGGLGLVALLALLLLRGSARKKKDNLLIRSQTKEIEEHRSQILESINYAERIQRSVLPSHSVVRKKLPGFHALYAPKDIVGGAYYWHIHVNGSSFLAVSDSNNPGVPGAFMSIIGATVLKELIVGAGMREPADILQEMDATIVELRKQGNSKASEQAIDIALVRLDQGLGRLTFAGANLNLYLKRAESALETIYGVPQGVAGRREADGPSPDFENQVINLDGIDGLFMSTHGVQHQPGVSRQEQFGETRFLELLRQKSVVGAVNSLPLVLQQWRGTNEQQDDICVVGVKI